MILKFFSKARTLMNLKNILISANIADIEFFTVAQWNVNPHNFLNSIIKNTGPGPWIVRSSCSSEDQSDKSNAGAFLSILNVKESDLSSAIEQVIASYRKPCTDDEILVQPFLQNVIRSGVAFSHDPNTCSPYRVINWSEGSDTSFVTSGAGGRIWQQASNNRKKIPDSLKPVLNLLDELINLFDGIPLDCEFAITSEGNIEKLWLLQVRPLILQTPVETNTQQTNRLNYIYSKIERGMKSHPFLMGKRTVYGVMPDWNPAEILGIRPKPLALSLYRELITDSIWAYQRHNYGYRNLRSFPLMPHFFGMPYIDVRLSFNSFVPADLDENLAGRLVDHYIDKLLEEPALHDKVEFEIVFSCYTLDLPKRLERLRKTGFTDSECENLALSLKRLTNRIIHPREGLWRADAQKLEILKLRREELISSSADPLEKIYWLLEDAKRYGTLPFAGLARAGFIAIQMLKSFVSSGVFSVDDYDKFLRSVSTVSGQLAHDRVKLNKSNFLSRYGHLRPGTYDILSPRYDEQPDLYFDWEQVHHVQEIEPTFSLTVNKMKEITSLLEYHELYPDAVGLLDFMQSAIELRELAKFHFTKNLSDILSLISDIGLQYGYNKDDMAFCDINIFKELHIAGVDIYNAISKSILNGKSLYNETLKLSLPPLITHPDDVWGFEWPNSSPNFITQKQITAHTAQCNQRDRLQGAIVCIPNADPGFDWLFSYPIAGLITAWGGANSHMAIRASELGLPAVIGAGELLFKRFSNANLLYIDCAGHRVEVLS